MNQKGFSLMEVLFSLILVATVAFGLLTSQQQNRQLLQQLILQAGASQFLDEVEENLVLKRDAFPKPPPPYQFNVKQSPSSLILELNYFQTKDPIRRLFMRIS